MIESIGFIKESLKRFFVDEEHGIDMVFTLRVRLLYHGLEVAVSGITSINEKYEKKFAHLISSNKDESELVIFLYTPALHEDVCAISMYCIRKDNVFEFSNETFGNIINMRHFKGLIGDEMIETFLKFRQGSVPSTLKPVKEGVGFDIVSFKRCFK